jgi:subtilisin family serine protease
LKRKIICVLVTTLLIATVLPAVGKMSKNINPNDPDFSKQWALHNTGQSNPYSGSGTPDADIDAPEGWDIEVGSSDVIIAIIDCGIDYTHPDLADNIWINEDEIPDNEIDDDSNGYIDDTMGWNFFDDNNDLLDQGGHGTLCAGTAAAIGNNNVGVTGVSWNSKIMPIHSVNEFDWGTFEDIADGIKYAADNGADVISMSFCNYTYSPLVNDAVDYAYNKGVVLVAAAGNEGTSSEAYPAAYDNVIAVAATDNTDSRMDVIRWGFIELVSNYGPWVDVAAPGVDIYTTMPTYEVSYNVLLGISQNYDYLSGTSLSCPIVAGIAALLLSHDPTLSPEEIKNLICKYVDPYNSEFDLGSGRVNAHKAIKKVKATSYSEISLSTLEEDMQFNRVVNTPFLNFVQNFLGSHPNMFPILRQLLGL